MHPIWKAIITQYGGELVEKGLYNPESDTETSVVALEQAILEVGSNLNVAQGVFYMLVYTVMKNCLLGM